LSDEDNILYVFSRIPELSVKRLSKKEFVGLLCTLPEAGNYSRLKPLCLWVQPTGRRSAPPIPMPHLFLFSQFLRTATAEISLH